MVKSKMRSPNDIAVPDNGTHSSFTEIKQHIAIKVLKTITNKTQDAISSRNCTMGVTMKTQSKYPCKSFRSSVEVIMIGSTHNYGNMIGKEAQLEYNNT